MTKDPEAPAGSCPVDHATRAAWLKTKPSMATFPGATAEASSTSRGNSCDSSQVDQQSTPRPKGIFSRFLSPTAPLPQDEPPSGLSVDREISTIPRAAPSNDSDGAKPANSEKESGTHASGNWIYPSEKMFFEAMKRKGYQTDAENMKTIVPIHNAVNERAWKEICAWEKPWGAYETCVIFLHPMAACQRILLISAAGAVVQSFTPSQASPRVCRQKRDSIHY
jgi:cytochrome c heme-lyase